MTPNEIQLTSVEQLRHFVVQTLCQQNDLEVDVFPSSEQVLLKRKQPIGMQFCLYGPRNVRFIAIWETEKHSILFYGSSGQRMARVQLSKASHLIEQLNSVALAS